MFFQQTLTFYHRGHRELRENKILNYSYYSTSPIYYYLPTILVCSILHTSIVAEDFLHNDFLTNPAPRPRMREGDIPARG